MLAFFFFGENLLIKESLKYQRISYQFLYFSPTGRVIFPSVIKMDFKKSARCKLCLKNFSLLYSHQPKESHNPFSNEKIHFILILFL
jgi:hypothetical protein